MTDPSDSRFRRPTPIHTVATDAPSYFTSQSLRRPTSLRQSSTPSPQAGQQHSTSRPSSSRQASTSITSEPINPQTLQTTQPPSLPDESTMRPRPFAPLFALVTDTTGPKPPRTHHPRVHYIFADDEDDDAFAAALASQHAGLPDTSSAASVRSGQHQKDRSIVLDLVPRDGEAVYDVRCASSLGSDWAVTNAVVSRMEGEVPAEGEGAFMLKIEGAGIEPTPRGPAAKEGKKDTQDEEVEYAQMMDQFEKRMVVLRKVVSALDEKSRAVAEREAEEEDDDDEEDGRDEANRPPWEEEAEDLKHDTG